VAGVEVSRLAALTQAGLNTSMILPKLLRFEIGVLSCAVTLLSIAGCAKHPVPSASSASTSRPAQPASAASTVAAPGTLFDGKTLTGWVPTDFSDRGTVTVTNGQINLGLGYMTGITWTNDMPRMGYEISLDAMRVEGSDFFCGLTFPVGKDYLSFIVGGWGGGVVGISSIDGGNASENETTTFMNFVNGRWHHIRLRVEPTKIQAWIDEDRVVNLETAERSFSIRIEMESSKPLGIATWNTAAALKNIQVKTL
jgi:hypothetical protein